MLNKDFIKRRQFLNRSKQILAGSLYSSLVLNQSCMNKSVSAKIIDTRSTYEKEPLLKPFGFKGSAITSVWQTVAYLKSDSGKHKLGLGTQSVLWSDSRVFAKHSEDEGNEIMFKITNEALNMLQGATIENPVKMQDDMLDELMKRSISITKQADLRKTFVLNALVPVDNALWLLWAEEQGIHNFDELIPHAYRSGMSAKNKKVVSIPALSYGTSMDTIKQLADDGFFIMKIKIGAPGTQDEMLQKDIEFLENIHKTIGHYQTKHTKDGKIPYYFDANGRYEKKESLHKFLDHAEKIGALEQIAVLEEPFGERNQGDVHDLVDRGPRVAADESAHTDLESLSRIQQGYNCIAVKAVAKTMSMTMKIAQLAFDNNIPCFCADLTVNPILVDWNKTVAARLPAFPEMPGLGLQETNGWQNYKNWGTMMNKHPAKNADWIHSIDGVYDTGESFMKQSGGIFQASEHYEKMFT